MMGERLINALSNYTSLPKERNGSCISSKEIENEYDRMERAKNGDGERKDGGCEG